MRKNISHPSVFSIGTQLDIATGTFEIGGPELMTFDEMIRVVMEVTGRRRAIIHIPESLMRLQK